MKEESESKFRRKVRLNYNYCVLCKEKSNLAQHHILKEYHFLNSKTRKIDSSRYNSPSNVVWLCEKCHFEKAHQGVWRNSVDFAEAPDYSANSSGFRNFSKWVSQGGNPAVLKEVRFWAEEMKRLNPQKNETVQDTDVDIIKKQNNPKWIKAQKLKLISKTKK